MLANFLKVAYRALLKNKGSSFVNIFGLSVAIGCSIVVFLFLEMQFTMDRFHEHGEGIFLVENIIDRDGDQQLWGDAPRPLGPAMKADFPQIERAARVSLGQGTFQHDDKVFNENLWFVDESFLAMFTFPLKAGDPNALAHEDAIILSEPLAVKYFGQDDPLGQQITITFNDEHVEAFTVRGVAERFPATASFLFDALIPFDKQRALGQDLDDWKAFTDATFIQLRDPADLPALAGQMDQYIALQNAANLDRPIAAFEFDNLYNLSIHSVEVRGDISDGSHPAALIVLSLIALFLLTLSCFNYINIALATAARRLKEIGVRKAMGCTKRQLVGQFLTENMLLCFLALVLGVAAAHFFLLPAWNSMFNFFGDDVGLSFATSPGLWVFLVALLTATGLASGAYPALYVARFQPTAIFRGQQMLGSGNLFTRALLTLQFVLAFITMIVGMAFTRNAAFQSERDWGYTQAHTYVVPLTEDGQYAALKNEVQQNPNVRALAGSMQHLGRSWGLTVVDVEGEKVEATRFDVGFGYLETLALRLKEGRFFAEHFGSDPDRAVVVNETFVRSRGWNTAVGQQIRNDSTAMTVVGVVEDFHYDDFYAPINPTVFFVADEADFRFLTMKVNAGAGMQTAEAVEAAWKRLFPDQPYDGFFQDTVFEEFYRETTNIKRVFAFVALMALIISCMGLFGLAAQNIARRMKEISIRKVLGATVASVTALINRGFLALLLIAAVIAIPLSYFLLEALLHSIYAFPMPLGPMPFVMAFVLMFATAGGAISSLIYKVVVTNPAEVLRNE